MTEQFKTFPDGHQELERLQYSPGEDHATIVTIVVSVVELLASFGLLAAILISAFNTRSSDDPRLFVRTHSAVFFISLVICAGMQAVGGIMSAAWVTEAGVVAGSLCTTQAVIKHISDVGVAVWSFVIAAHSFLLLWRAGGPSITSREPVTLLGHSVSSKRFVKWTTVAATWLFIFIVVTLGPEIMATHRDGDFYGISGEWCWISDRFPLERILFAYLIMISSAFISLALYAGAFYHVRSKLHLHKPASEYILSKEDQADEYAFKLSRYMIGYPLAYFFCLAPVAIQRFAVWGGAEVHFGAVVFTDSVYHLLGIVHLILFLCTPRLLPPLTVFPANAFFGTGAYESERAESYAHPKHAEQKHFVKSRRPPPLQIAPLLIPVPSRIDEKSLSPASPEAPTELVAVHLSAQDRKHHGCGMHAGPLGRPGLPCRPGSRTSSRSHSSLDSDAARAVTIPPPAASPSQASIRSFSSVSSTSSTKRTRVHPNGLPARPSSRASSIRSRTEADDAEDPFADPPVRARLSRAGWLAGLPSHPAAAVHPRESDASNVIHVAVEKSQWSASTATASTATATLSAYMSAGARTTGRTGSSRGSARPQTAMSTAASLSGFQMVTNAGAGYAAPHVHFRIEEQDEDEDEMDEPGQRDSKSQNTMGGRYPHA